MTNEQWHEDEAPPTEEELAEAAKLRDALEGQREPFAAALRAAHAPTDIAPEAHERIVAQALDHFGKRRRSNVIRVAFGAIAFAAAAGFVLFFSTTGSENIPTYARARSAQALFDEPFPAAGGTSARVDRIADARSRDLRANRFASWGVK